DANNFTVLMVAAIAAAAFGRLRSLPLTLAGGVVLGVGQELLTKFLPLGNELVKGLRPSAPFILLFGLLLFWPGLRRAQVPDPLAGVSPPPPALAASLRDEGLDRLTGLLFPVLLTTFMAVSLFVLPSFWLFLVTQGVVFSIIFLSLTLVVVIGRPLSL